MEVKARIAQKKQGRTKQHIVATLKAERRHTKQKLQFARSPQTARMKSPATHTAERGRVSSVERLRRMLSPVNQYSVRSPKPTKRPNTEHPKGEPEKSPFLLFLSKMLAGAKIPTEELAQE